MSDVIRERKVEIGIGVFLLVGIGAFLLIPAVFPADTIILVNPETGGGPVSCLPSGALILAQNLTDLCDVTIIAPASGQLIQYNGTQWVNVNNATIIDDTVCTNIGIGTAYVCVEGSNISTRSILAGVGISASNNSNTITISNTLPENTVCTNQTATIGGQGLCINDSIELRNIAASGGIGVTANATHVIIANDGVTSLITPAGGGVTIDQATGDITITSYCDNQGAGVAVCDGGNQINSLIAGTGMTVTDTVDDITLASQCANTGTGEAVCESSNNINSLIAGSGISITDTTGDLTITSTPSLSKLCESVASGGETTLTCTLSPTGGKGFIIQSVYSSSLADTWALRFNADGGNNYAARTSVNGGADATSASIAHLGSALSIASQQITYNYECEQRGSGFEKYCYGFRMTSATGATNVPSRVEFAVKWTNTASVVTTVDLVRTAGIGTLEANSYIVVWGLN